MKSRGSARRIRVTFVFTHHIRWVPFELAATLIDKNQFEIDYVILGTSDPIIDFLKKNNIPVVSSSFDDYKNTPEVVKFVYDHLIKNQTDIVQTHWFAGSLVGMQAAYYANVPVRIFHREHPPLQYYNRHPTSKHQLIWDCATHLIAVTHRSKAGMVEDGIPEGKITVIPTGFDLAEFKTIDSLRVDKLREKYLDSDEYVHKRPIIGVVARYVKWKGVEFVIRAFKQVLDQYPDALLILAGTHIERSLVLEKIKAACEDAGVPVPNIFTEFGSFTVGESGGAIYKILYQIITKSTKGLHFFSLAPLALMGSIKVIQCLSESLPMKR